MEDNQFIAILTDEYIDYRKVIIDRISAVMHEAGYGTLCIAGRELRPSGRHHQSYDVCNQIYQLVNDTGAAGIVCLSGALGQNIAVPAMNEFAASFTAPVVSYGLALDGIPGIVFDDAHGMTQLMEHLLNDTGRTRFAFVRGHPNDRYSMAREAIFCQMLKQHGRDVSDCIFLEGNYDAVETYNAVTRMLTQQTQPIDAIVAANDIMALSAAKAASATGLRIPQDLLISGFDDTHDATKNAPALTTVRQPLQKMAEVSARLLLGQIEQREHQADHGAPIETICSELVVRGSTVVLAADDGVETLCDADTLAAQLRRLMSGLRAPEGFDPNGVCVALWDTLSNRSNALECYLQDMLRKYIRTEDIHWWSNLCHQLEKLSLQVLSDESDNEHRAIVAAAIAKVQERIWSVRMDQSFEVQRLQSLHTSMQTEMSACTELVDILATMGRWVEAVGVRRCFLVRYLTPSFTVCDSAELLYSYSDRHDESNAAAIEEFSTRQLLPQSLADELTNGMLVLNPIYAGNDQFGYLLLDPQGLDRLQIDSVAQSIGNAMRNQYLISTLELQTADLQAVNTNLVHLANHDVLTGLPNRLQFQKYLCERCDNEHHHASRLALLFVDLDGFKEVNDTLGHGAGDLLLQQVSERLLGELNRTIGSKGFLARLGGDEFTIVLDLNNGDDVAQSLCARLLDELCRSFDLEEETVHVSASIGCALFPEHGDCADELLRAADTAMYKAKEMGKNQSVIYNANLDRITQPEIAAFPYGPAGNDAGNDTGNNSEAKTTERMQAALINGEMRMLFQPRIDTHTGDICAVEALMRWVDSESGADTYYMMPDEFIPFAERTGLITQLDEFALDQSCRAARQWELSGASLSVSVNISVLTLQQETFLSTVERLLKKHAVNPSLIEFEITETAAMTDTDKSIVVMQCLRDMGVQLSIDDFGTGYSSLNYLKLLPVNHLKIDRSFVGGIDSSNEFCADTAIIKAVVALGQSLRFGLVAEGVETQAQLDFVTALGCDQAQGYFFSMPVDVDTINRMLTTNRDKAA